MLTTTDFSDEEFKEALLQMDPNKVPRVDGLNPAFFQQCWNILGTDISDACRSWLA